MTRDPETRNEVNMTTEKKTKAEEAVIQPRAFKVKTIAFNGLMVRDEPKISAGIVGVLKFGSIVEVQSTRGGFGKISDPDGWIDMSLVVKR